MNMAVRILAFIAAFMLLVPAAALADNNDANANYLEFGYRNSNPDNVSKSDQGYFRGSVYIQNNVSFTFEGAAGSLKRSFDGSTKHNLIRLGLAYREMHDFGYWELAGSYGREEYGNDPDQYGRIQYGAHGRYRNNFGWDAAVLYNLKDDVADRTAGVLLGARYRASDNLVLVLDSEVYNHDTTIHLGMRWFY